MDVAEGRIGCALKFSLGEVVSVSYFPDVLHHQLLCRRRETLRFRRTWRAEGASTQLS